ncbi:hypothetical protein [Neobacillus niacini]|uniref:hypothetical protein n=1 Tax=Neobacillus niacini TaxID=86668 RepID=UPI0021CB91BE|nr:hypothetical protein [Neobacillus niacini]MCM3766124.1 hypothetical protein [Neobacillus niacini]
MGLSFKPLIELEFNDSIVTFVTKGIGSSIIPRMVSTQLKHATPAAIIKSIDDPYFQRSIDLLYKDAYRKKASEILKHLDEAL